MKNTNTRMTFAQSLFSLLLDGIVTSETIDWFFASFAWENAFVFELATTEIK